jgi:hypothetical protein
MRLMKILASAASGLGLFLQYLSSQWFMRNLVLVTIRVFVVTRAPQVANQWTLGGDTLVSLALGADTRSSHSYCTDLIGTDYSYPI